MEFLAGFMMKVGSTKLDGGGGKKSLTLDKFGAKRRTSVCFQVAVKRGKEKEASQPRRLEYFPFPINLLILARSPLFIILLVKGFVLLQVAGFRAPFSPSLWENPRVEGRGKEKRWPSKMADREKGEMVGNL